jgi:hypothetical protein
VGLRFRRPGSEAAIAGGDRDAYHARKQRAPGMPFRLLFDRARRVIVIRFGAAMDEPSIKRMRAAVKAFVEREGDCPAIVDFTAVTEANVAGRFVAELARAAPGRRSSA